MSGSSSFFIRAVVGKQTAGPSQKPKWRHLGWEDQKLDFSRPGEKMHFGEKVVVGSDIGIIHLFSSNFSNIPNFGRLLFEFSKISKSCLRIFEFHY